MTEKAEDALTQFMETPLKFGAMCTESSKEEWRLTRQWARMLADHINAIITNPGATSNEELSDTLDLIVLLSNKLAFINYHKRHLAKRLLNPVKGFEARCMELENAAISRLQKVCDGLLLSKCTRLLGDHDSSRQFSEELARVLGSGGGGGDGGGGARGGGGGGGGGGVPIDFDMRYLSKRVWRECGVW
jgi:uncharacterized membrane protein YgcG